MADAREQRAHARDDLLGLALLGRIGVPAELEVDAPDAVGLPVQQHALARMEGRVEPEPALGRAARPSIVTSAIRKRSWNTRPVRLQAEHLPHRGARAVAGDHVVGVRAVVALGRLDREQHAVGVRLDADHLVVPAQVDRGSSARALDEVPLDVVLLQVDEGRPLVAGLGQQVEAVDLLVA